MEQPLYNLVARQRVEREYQSLIHSEEGLGLTTYSPLAEGILAGRYLDKGKVAKGSRAEFKKFLLEKESELELARQLKPLAMRLGVSLAQLALAWTLRNQDVSSVIMGASRAEQVIDNVKAVALVAPGGLLTDEVLAQMEKLAASFAPTEDRIKKPISENLAKHRGPYHGGKRRVEL
ncbi:unnamed protein product [Amoebophrya sp. A25]|nr:unnamed protein product [Amoebophrya sp. A25]|eukprot:GSA25T00002996001.1